MIDDIKVRELSFKEIFNTSFKIYSANWKAIAIITILVYIPIMLLDRFVISESMGDLQILLGIDATSNYANSLINLMLILMAEITNMPIELMDEAVSILYMIFAASMVSVAVFSPLLASGSTYLTNEFVEGRQGTVENMTGVALSNIVKTTATAILSLACISIGMIMFFAPGIYMAICFAFVTPAVIMTGKWGFGALKESFLVVKGRWFKTLAFIMLSNAFALVSMQVFAIIKSIIYLFLPQNFIISIVMGVISSIMLTYFVMVECLWFVNKYLIQKA